MKKWLLYSSLADLFADENIVQPVLMRFKFRRPDQG